jgi:hypothetical protein
MAQLITSAALYFDPKAARSVPGPWLERAIRLLAEAGLPVQEFSMTTTARSPSGPYSFRAHKDMLEREVQAGNVVSLHLYANPARGHGLLFDWYGLAYLGLADGICFLGLPRNCEASPSALLRLTCSIPTGVNEIPYGIGYFHEYLKGPDFYALGAIANPDPAIYCDIEARAAADRITKWLHESLGPRRYLKGWFRGAYPASILSEAHVNAPFLGGLSIRAAGLGRLTTLDRAHWLWELTDQEMVVAEGALRESGLMICT